MQMRDRLPTTARRLDATVDLEVTVPRGGDGTLRDGVVAVLDRSEAVADAEVTEINGVSPTQNDLHVDVSVRIGAEFDDRIADRRSVVRDALADQFGVESVTAVETDRPTGSDSAAPR